MRGRESSDCLCRSTRSGDATIVRMIDQQLHDALVGAVLSSSENVASARKADAIVRARAYATLSGIGATDRQIRRQMGWSRRQLWAAQQTHGFSRNEFVAEVWGVVNLSSPISRRPDRLLSGEIVAAHGIAVRHYPNATYLDTSGAEYVDHRTGDRWLLFSQNRWDGRVKSSSPDGAFVGGCYEVWHQSSSDELVNVDIGKAFGVDPGIAHFRTPGLDEHRTDSDAFAAVRKTLLTHLGCVDDDAWQFDVSTRRRWWKRLLPGRHVRGGVQ